MIEVCYETGAFQVFSQFTRDVEVGILTTISNFHIIVGNLNLPSIPCWYNGYTYAVGLVDRYGSSLGTIIHRKCSEHSGPFLCLPGFRYTSLGTRSINIWHHIIWSVVFTRDVSLLVEELWYRRSHTQWRIKH